MPVFSSDFVRFCVSKLRLLFYFKTLICVLNTVFFVSINFFYPTVKLVKCCMYVCYMQINASYLLTYILTYFTNDQFGMFNLLT